MRDFWEGFYGPMWAILGIIEIGVIVGSICTWSNPEAGSALLAGGSGGLLFVGALYTFLAWLEQ